MSKRSKLILFLALALLLAYAGNYFRIGPDYGEQDEATPSQSRKKMQEMMRYIEAYYVDEVNWDQAVTGAIEGFLQTLDPHSVYFSVEEVRENEENFEGRYYGIGIHYDVINGFITVLSVISGSPSEKAGILAGDRIIEIEGESAEGISHREVQRRLKGPRNTEVTVNVMRPGVDDPLEFTLKRDEIPISTLNTYFMVDGRTGYIWLSRFASKTDEEMETALIKLEKQGMDRLILDLRGNTGGFLRQAVRIVGKFIHGSKLVVYTKGQDEESIEEYYTDDFGHSLRRDYPLIVLINHNSASASEIVAGAIQDYDRGLIAGTNSFGKGLVQNEFVLNDGSRIRITVSKYYTPSGRLIQRPYEGKDRSEYYYQADSVLKDSLEEGPLFKTRAGRHVYGGGGIKPDTTIESESIVANANNMYQLIQKGVLVDVASWYVKRHELMKASFDSFQTAFRFSPAVIEQIEKTSRQKEVELIREDILKDGRFLSNRLKAEIARSVWGTMMYWQVILEEDNQFQQALGLFPEVAKLSELTQTRAPKFD